MKRTKWIRRVAFLAVGAFLGPGPAEAQSGRVELGEFTSPALATNLLGDSATRKYQVYLPPSYDRGTNRYPVIYVLHGYLGNEVEQVSGVRTSLDALIRQRQIGELVAVFANGDNRLRGSFCLDSPVIGNYEAYLAQDLVRRIDERYRTLAVPESRGITGYSMGGWGAMHLALKFPDVFSVVVAQGGFYDAQGVFVDNISRQLAQRTVTNLVQFDGLGFPLNAGVALFAGLAPNLERPALYTDYLYERVDGQLRLMDAVWQRVGEGDIQHADLPRYLGGTVRLRGIKVVHGTADPVIPISEARQFTNALTAAGLEFDFQEHAGGHVYRPEMALPFLSAHLQGAERYIAPPRLSLTFVAGQLRMTFSTQTNVQYFLESTETLGGIGAGWADQRQFSGHGGPAIWDLPLTDAGRFFRVRAVNVP